jgi:hypothetical protein
MIASHPGHVVFEPRHRLATAGGADRYDEVFQSRDEARFGQLRLLRRITSSDGCRVELEEPAPAGCGHQGLRFCGPRLQRQTRP